MTPGLLAVFDIDGTLIDSTGLDDRCYLAALAEVFEIDGAADGGDWDRFADVTDTGVLDELLRRTRGTPPSAAEIARFERAFVTALERQIAVLGIEPIAGAGELLARLEADSGWTVAMATGGFRAAAETKLAAAGLAPAEVLATSDRLPQRSAIVLEAIGLAGGEPAGTVLVGDAPWDARTAAELELPFVGVAAGDRRRRLEELGAIAVLDGFADLRGSVRTLERAARDLL